MAAPSGTVWGSAVGSGWVQSRLGIYKSVSTTATSATVTVQIWYWSKSSVNDQNNNLYYTISSTSSSAKDNRGNVAVVTTNYDNGGSGWATSNQIKLKTYTYTYTRGTAAIKRYLYAKLDTVEYAGGTPKVSTTFTVPALASYTVSYNANGGTGAPSSQTKYYGKTLTLRTGAPTRTGYNFVNWKSTQGSTAYYFNPGDTTTYNGNQTMYAQWQKKTYTIKYNANGGTGAPSSQTKTYGTNLTLSSTKPTRASKSTTDEEGVVTTTSYTFLGWSTNPDAKSATWVAGGTYTSNSGATLYAVWRESTSSVDTEFIVSYDANGGEDAPDYQVKKKDVALTLRTGKPVWHGYSFVNWKSTQGNATYTFNPGDTTTYNGDQVMVAQWTPWSHTVKFNVNGGTSSVPASFTKTTGTEKTIAATIPTKTNHSFMYWCTSADGNGLRYNSGDEYDYLQNGGTVTLYAIWGKNGVEITSAGKMKGKEFIEDSEMLGFSCFGEVYAKEFIEGSVAQMGENNFKFIEFIER